MVLEKGLTTCLFSIQQQAQVKLLALTLLKFYPRDKQQTYRTQSPKILRTNTKP